MEEQRFKDYDAQKRNDFPIALDEEIAREELNAPQEFEEIEFNEEEED